MVDSYHTMDNGENASASAEAAAAPPATTNLDLRGLARTTLTLSFLAGTVYGYTTGVIAGALDQLDDKFDLSDLLEGVVTASILVGAMTGSSIGGMLGDTWGRKKSTWVAAVVSCIGCVLTAMSPWLWFLILSRTVLGLGVGVFGFIVPMYVAEVAPKEKRGQYGTVFQLSVCWGIFVAYCINLAFKNVEHGWRYMFGIGLVPCAAILVLSLFFLPYSPRWLVSRGREAEARPLLDVMSHGRADMEIAAIRESADVGQQAAWSDVWSPRYRRQLFIGIGLCVANQLTGINAIMYFGPRIFKAAGLTSDTASLAATVGVGAWNFLATVGATSLVDRKGRRSLMLSGLVLMAFASLLMSLAFVAPFGDARGPVAIVMVFVFVGGFEIGPGPLFFLYISEIYPINVRGKALAFLSLVVWTMNLIVSVSFLALLDGLGKSGTFFIYGCSGLLSAMYLFYRAPETRGKSLEEIARMLGSAPEQPDKTVERQGFLA